MRRSHYSRDIYCYISWLSLCWFQVIRPYVRQSLHTDITYHNIRIPYSRKEG